MRYDKLPPALKAQVDRELGKTKSKKNRAVAPGSEGLPLTCSRCDFVTTGVETQMAKHSAEFPGHGTFVWRA